MARYIDNTNNSIQKSYHELKADNSGKSLPKDGTEIIFIDWYMIHVTSQPTYDVNTQVVVEITPIKTGEVYNQAWQINSLSAQEITDLLDSNKENAQNQLDAECKAYLYSYWSAEAQSNVAMGLYEQAMCELAKQEIGDVLSENTGFVAHIDTLTTVEDITAYVDSITRLPITGGQ